MTTTEVMKYEVARDKAIATSGAVREQGLIAMSTLGGVKGALRRLREDKVNLEPPTTQNGIDFQKSLTLTEGLLLEAIQAMTTQVARLNSEDEDANEQVAYYQKKIDALGSRPGSVNFADEEGD